MAGQPEIVARPAVPHFPDEIIDDRVAAVLVVAIVVTAALTWGPRLARPLWYDEAFTVENAVVSSYSQMLFRYRTGDPNSPPATYLLVKVWAELTGSTSPRVVRLPFFAAALCCVPLGFVAGRLLGGNVLGLSASVVAAADPVLGDHAAQARQSAILCLTSVAGLVLLLRLLTRTRNTGAAAVALGATLGIGLWNSQLALAAWGMTGGTLLLWVLRVRAAGRDGAAERKRAVLAAGLVAVAAGVTGLPGILDIVFVRLRQDSGTAVPSASVIVGEIAGRLPLVLPAAHRWLGLVAVAFALGLGVVRFGWRVTPLLILTAVSLVLAYLLRARHTFFTTRYLVPMLPAVWLGFGMLPLVPRHRLLQACGGLATLGYLALCVRFLWLCAGAPAEADPEYRASTAAGALRAVIPAGEPVAFSPDYTDTFGVYYGLPLDREFQTGLRSPAGVAPPPPAVWLVAVRYDGLQKFGVRDALRTLASRFSKPLDEELVERLLAARRPLAVRFAPDRLEYYAVPDGLPVSWEREGER